MRQFGPARIPPAAIFATVTALSTTACEQGPAGGGQSSAPAQPKG